MKRAIWVKMSPGALLRANATRVRMSGTFHSHVTLGCAPSIGTLPKVEAIEWPPKPSYHRRSADERMAANPLKIAPGQPTLVGAGLKPALHHHPDRHSRVRGKPCPGHLPREGYEANPIFHLPWCQWQPAWTITTAITGRLLDGGLACHDCQRIAPSKSRPPNEIDTETDAYQHDSHGGKRDL